MSTWPPIWLGSWQTSQVNKQTACKPESSSDLHRRDVRQPDSTMLRLLTGGRTETGASEPCVLGRKGGIRKQQNTGLLPLGWAEPASDEHEGSWGHLGQVPGSHPLLLGLSQALFPAALHFLASVLFRCFLGRFWCFLFKVSFVVTT